NDQHPRVSMSRKAGLGVLLALLVVGASAGAWYAWRSLRGADGKDPPPAPADPIEQRFSTQVQPFLQRYCFGCHGAAKQEASLDPSRAATVSAVAQNARQWQLVLERLQAEEMPPEEAPRHPEPGERAA